MKLPQKARGGRSGPFNLDIVIDASACRHIGRPRAVLCLLNVQVRRKTPRSTLELMLERRDIDPLVPRIVQPHITGGVSASNSEVETEPAKKLKSRRTSHPRRLPPPFDSRDLHLRCASPPAPCRPEVTGNICSSSSSPADHGAAAARRPSAAAGRRGRGEANARSSRSEGRAQRAGPRQGRHAAPLHVIQN